jgi:SAM-dependent methyltransferase|tara:strand:- start:300 stop:1076 length:777 start_codon:yes stop_codon:yes gene_type:complete
MYEELRKRVERERTYHNQEKDVSKKAFNFKKLFRNYFSNPSLIEMENDLNKVKNISNKKVLDFGCGYGKDFDDLLLNDNELTGIDISELYIRHCTNYCNKNFKDKKFSFFAMDAHDLKFEDETFDLIIGRGILHHLDFNIALKGIKRVLKKDGEAYFQEPLGDNPLLKIFRIITPNLRTKDERPFYKKDLIKLERDFNIEFKYYGMISFIASIITSPFTGNGNNFFVKLLYSIEKKLLKHNYFKYFGHYVIFKVKKNQ